MTQLAAHVRPGVVEPGPAGRLAALRPLHKVAKLTVVQHYFGIPLAATLLPATVVWSARSLAVLGLCLLCMAGVVAATTALDDLTGYRDGSDALNYGTAGRGSRTKPLLQGGVSQRSVLGFAAVSEAVALLAGFGALAVASRWTLAPVALFLLPALLSPHYSWGLRISYRPFGGELLVLLATVATLLWPYTLLAGGGTGALPAVEAALLGVWFLIVVASENTNDIPGDRAAGRRTLSVVLGPATMRRVLAGLIASWTGLVAAGVGAGVLTPAVPLLLVPTLALHIWHLAVESRWRRWLRGAAVSFLAFNLGSSGCWR